MPINPKYEITLSWDQYYSFPHTLSELRNINHIFGFNMNFEFGTPPTYSVYFESEEQMFTFRMKYL